MEKIIGRYKIKVVQDENPINPRSDDNLGKMICFHRRYNLGDKHDYDHEDYSGWDEMERAIMRKENGSVILPLYLYDHSGITMNTTGFSCPWDSGQVGFIVAPKKEAKEWFGVKRITKDIRERIEKNLVGEVETYDKYLTGEVYGFEIWKLSKKKGKEKEMIDSCWGYYDEDYCMREAEGYVPKQELEENIQEQ